MRTAERDELQERRTLALEGVQDELRRQRERRGRQEWRDSRRPLRRLFGGERGAIVLLRTIPGFADLWTDRVPAPMVLATQDREGVKWRIVRCSCGEQTAMRPGAIGECAGAHQGCRWFFHTGPDVRFRDFPPEPAAA